MSPLLNDGEAFYGYIHSIDDALLLVEAVRRRLVPRIFYRLTDSEQLSIRSGSVFVWHEDEANIKRWTVRDFISFSFLICSRALLSGSLSILLGTAEIHVVYIHIHINTYLDICMCGIHSVKKK
ncbi:hypothetical protein HMI55_004017 [Coelomomyces lativittatus]|nr:hypothetical protein HMI56_004890 [Coelomomyces lativittatus]KAJ1500166.1 hypothetical protein HMI55_004017 [Coelomomyces lativittatus]